MLFRVLGPLAVERDGQPVKVGAPLELAVLARLLLDPCEPVAKAALVEGLWPSCPPPSAARTLDSMLSRWRTRLGGGRIERVGVGAVRLLVDEDEVDALRFRSLISSGAGPTHEGTTSLDAALGLWRGTPYPELIDWPDAAPVVAELVELRLTAQETHADRVLASGGHRVVLAECEHLVAAEPLRERRWVQLVTALAGSGRQADALAAVARCRRLLVERAGVEPGPELVGLERRVLAQDAALFAGPEVPAAARPIHTADRFFGRTAELSRLRAALGAGRLVTLTGPGGVGKTRLVIEMLPALADQFDDGRFFVELAPLSAGADISFTVGDALGVKRQSGESVESALLRWFGSRNALLVLDNAEHVIDSARRLATALGRSCPHVVVLVTSRRPLDAPGEVLLDIPVLGSPANNSDAIELFADRARARRADFDLRQHEPAVAELCAELDHLPLAVELAAARCRSLTPAEINERLRATPRTLRGGHLESRHGNLDRCIAWSVDLLTAEEAHAFAQLAVFRNGFDLAAASAVLEHDAAGLIEALVEQSLLLAASAGSSTRFRMLEPIRQWAARRLEPATEQRHAAYYAELASQIDRAFLGDDTAGATSMFDLEFANLRAAHDAALRHGLLDTATALVVDIGWIAREQIAFEVLHWCEATRQAATSANHPRRDDVVATAIGFHFLDHDADAVAHAARHVLGSSASSPIARYRAAFDHAWMLLHLGRRDEAIGFAHQALTAAESIGNDVLCSGARSTLGVCLGAGVEAAEHVERGVQLADRAGSDYASATSRLFAGQLLPLEQRLGLVREAAMAAERAGVLQFGVVTKRILAEELLVAGGPVPEAAGLLVHCLEVWSRRRLRTHWHSILEVAAQCLAGHGRTDVAQLIWDRQAADGVLPIAAARRSELHVGPSFGPRASGLDLDELSALAIRALNDLAVSQQQYRSLPR